MSIYYLLTNIGFATAENEPPKVSMRWGIDPRFPLSPLGGRRAQEAGASGRIPGAIAKAVATRTETGRPARSVGVQQS